MITGGTGGANTLTGLIYEGKVDLKTFLNQQQGYRVRIILSFIKIKRSL